VITYEWSSPTSSPVVTYENPLSPPTVPLPATPGFLEIGAGTEGKIYTSVVECFNGNVSGRRFPVEVNQPGQPGFVANSTQFSLQIQYAYSNFGPAGAFFIGPYKEPAGVSESATEVIFTGYTSPSATTPTVITVMPKIGSNGGQLVVLNLTAQ
jgi:hypothetical protein